MVIEFGWLYVFVLYRIQVVVICMLVYIKILDYESNSLFIISMGFVDIVQYVSLNIEVGTRDLKMKHKCLWKLKTIYYYTERCHIRIDLYVN